MTTLSDMQNRAFDKILEWYREPDSPQVFYLAGYAGTGKSTLVKFIADEIGSNVLFAAPTGKAAHAMMKRGVHYASTIHSLIYTPYNIDPEEQITLLRVQLVTAALKDMPGIHAQIEELRKEGHRPKFALNEESPLRSASILFLDECSMVDKKIGEDLLSFGTRILVLGDPAQLPPVRGAGFFTSNDPDFLLTEIHRQAQDDPILRIATAARNGEAIANGRYGDNALVVSRDDIKTSQIVHGYEQVLCGYNKTRHLFNFKARRIYGRNSPYPMAGEKLISLKNDYDNGFLNGMMVHSTMDAHDVDDDPEALEIEVAVENRDNISVNCIKSRFVDSSVDPGILKRRLMDFDYGYAVTVHKSQGSEWESVCLLDDGFGKSNDRDRWLYTGITRARSKLLIVR